ncbi:PQQ-binding-like beta-propeller repeat protein [Streptomyces xinghaiensis]|uniref:outer membrane protein assembly factor BamB family protein n=1 Tax=Streptomyces xinghaiensis TaxID=1038928 RepID=UPI003C2C8506
MATPPQPGPGAPPPSGPLNSPPQYGPYPPPPWPGPYPPPPAQTWQGPNPYARTPHPPAAGPAVPPPPGHPPSPPSRRGRAPLFAAVLVLLLALAGGSWVYFGSGGGAAGGPEAGEASPPPEHPHRVKSAMSWEAPAPKGEIKDYVASDAGGTWFTDTTVVKAEIRELKVYSRKDGKVQGTVPLPGEICGERPPPHDGTVALAYRDGDGACARLTLIDIGKRQRVWTAELPSAHGDGEQVRWIVMARMGDRVIVAGENTLRALSAADGEEQWEAGLPEGRLAGGLAGGERLLATSYRLSGGTAADYQVNEIDPADGGVRWSWSVPEGQRPNVFASVSPLVVGLVSIEQHLVNQFVALDGKGRERSRVRVAAKGSETGKDGPEQTFEPRCGYAGDGCSAAVVADDTLYLPTQPAEADSDAGTEFNKLAAFDLATGDVKWSAAAGDKRTVIPVDVDGGNVIGYAEPTGESGGRLLRFDADSGKASLYQQHPDSDSENERDAYYTQHPPLDVYLDRGQFFIVCESLTGSEEFLIVAYE